MVRVLGRGTDVQFTIDDSVPFAVAEQSLRDYLELCQGLYAKGTVSVNVGRRILFPDQINAIKSILNQETGLTITEYWCPPDVLQKAQSNQDLPQPPTLRPPFPEYTGGHPAQKSGHSEKSCHSERSEESNTAAPDQLPESASVVETPQEEPPEPQVSAPETPPVAVSHQEPEPQAQQEDAPTPQNRQLSLFSPDMNAGQEEAAQQETPAAQQETATDRRSSRAGTRPSQTGGNLDSSDDPGAFPEPDITTTAHSRSPFHRHSGESRNPGGPAELGPVILSEAKNPGGPAELGSVILPVSGSKNEGRAKNPGAPPIRGDQALILKTTCRSGEVIRYPGDVVIFGDVNPGAQIIAGGDVIVLGALRGMAHAGADGDPKATIFALNLAAHRLQIGPHVGEAPRDQKRNKSLVLSLSKDNNSVDPKIAYLRRRSVFVAPFVRRSEDYQGGVLYEG